MRYALLIASVAAAVLAGNLAAAGGGTQGLLMAAVAAVAVLLAVISPRSGLMLLVFSMLLSPEINIAGIAGTGRNIVVRYDDVLLIALFLAWFAKTAILKDKPIVFRSPVQNPIALYTAVCVLSTALGVLGGRIRWEFSVFYVAKYVEYFFLYFMTFNIVESREEMRRYLKAGAFVAVLVTIYAVWYYLNAGPGARASAPFEAPLGNPKESEPASLGGYYLLVFGMLFGAAAEMPFGRLLWSLAAVAAMLPAFLLTLSRASYIGLAFSGAAAIALSGKRRLFLAGMLALGGTAVLLTPFLSGPATDRIKMTYTGSQATAIFNTPAGEIRLEESAAQRVRAWERSVFYWLPKHPLIGNGVTGTGLTDAQLPLVIGETGLIGLALWLWMIWVCFRVAWRLYSRGSDAFVRSVSLGYMLGLIGLLWQSAGVNTFIIVRIMEPFWFLTAMVMKLHQFRGEEPAAD